MFGHFFEEVSDFIAYRTQNTAAVCACTSGWYILQATKGASPSSSKKNVRKREHVRQDADVSSKGPPLGEEVEITTKIAHVQGFGHFFEEVSDFIAYRTQNTAAVCACTPLFPTSSQRSPKGHPKVAQRWTISQAQVTQSSPIGHIYWINTL